MSKNKKGHDNEDPMPRSTKDKLILDQRAKVFSKNLDADENDEQKQPYIRFRLGDAEEYGILYRHAEEILPFNAVTKVPCTPAHI